MFGSASEHSLTSDQAPTTGIAVDGPFQLYNARRRIQAGYRPGIDFQFFHGMGEPYAHCWLYRVHGGVGGMRVAPLMCGRCRRFRVDAHSSPARGGEAVHRRGTPPARSRGATHRVSAGGIRPKMLMDGHAIIDAHRGPNGEFPLLWSTYSRWIEANHGRLNPSLDNVIRSLGPDNRHGAYSDTPVSLAQYEHRAQFLLLASPGQTPSLHFQTFSLLPGAAYAPSVVRVYSRPMDERNQTWGKLMLQRYTSRTG